MRRRPVGVRRGPGLVGTVARTAVIAGTATVTAKAVGGGMDSRAAAQQQAAQQQAAQQQDLANANATAAQSQADMQQMQAQMQQMQYQMAQQQPQQPAQVAAAPAAPKVDMASQLQQLAQLKESGVLSEDEFQAAKAKILAG